MVSGPGRPRTVSKAVLQEAAFELFQLRGYAATSIELITRTAGCSRATFFNLFASKSEVFWLETDQLLERLRLYLADAETQVGAASNKAPINASAMNGTTSHGATFEAAATSSSNMLRASLVAELMHFATLIRSSDIPWALQNAQLLAASEDLLASGAARVQTLTQLLSEYLMRHHGYLSKQHQNANNQSSDSETAPNTVHTELCLQADAAAISARVLIGLRGWIDAGVRRDPFTAVLQQVLAAEQT